MCVSVCACVRVLVCVCVCVCVCECMEGGLLCFLVVQCIPLVLLTVVREWHTDLDDTHTAL